jgi:transposase
VRPREAAKQDQLRARHRLSKFLLRSGQRPPTGIRPWTRPYLLWVAQLRFTQMAQEATRLDYLHEGEHMRERVTLWCRVGVARFLRHDDDGASIFR